MRRSTFTRVTASAGWSYACRWVDRLLSFGAVAVLARLLAPEDFGLVAIAASWVAIVEGMSDFDVNSALIRTRDADRSLYDSAWTLAVIRGGASALVIVLVGVLVVPAIGDPRLTPVLVALAASPLLVGLSNPRFVMFERDLDYSRLAVLTLAARIAAFGVTVGLAVRFESYWALVGGPVSHGLTSLGLSYALRPYRPRLSRARWADIMGFSGWMSLTTLVTTVSMQTDRIIVGRLLGLADAGVYYMTQRVAVVPTAELVSPIRRILFPSFSEMAGDRPRLRRTVGEAIGILGSLSLPAGVGFALVANDVVPIVLGAEWAPIVPLLCALVPFLGLRAATSVALPGMMALGETRVLLGASVMYAVVHLPLFVAGTARFGLPGAVGSIVLAGTLYIGLNLWMLRRTLGLPAAAVARQLRRPLGAVAVMAGAVAGADLALPLDLLATSGSWVSLGVKVVVGAGVYVVAHAAFWWLEGCPAGIERRLWQLVAGLGRP